MEKRNRSRMSVGVGGPPGASLAGLAAGGVLAGRGERTGAGATSSSPQPPAPFFFRAERPEEDLRLIWSLYEGEPAQTISL